MGDVVLIADDDEDIVCFVGLNLRLEGFDVVAAHDGQEALTKQGPRHAAQPHPARHDDATHGRQRGLYQAAR
jgi:CheY-like chemotaxis protein